MWRILARGPVSSLTGLDPSKDDEDLLAELLSERALYWPSDRF